MSAPFSVDRPLVIWRILDGKPGHENQTLGLANALGRLRPVAVHAVAAPAYWRAWLDLMLSRCPAGEALPAPDLILGVGNRTHPALLACQRARGGHAVVLMRPSLPAAWFDLCLVPEHDEPVSGEHVVQTRGVLNAMMPAEPDPKRPGMILIGGPSEHHGWDSAQLLSQVRQILARERRTWLLVTSRRTPEATEQALAQLTSQEVTLVPWRDAPPGWLAAKLPGTPVAWVTADSVSMLYEALTAGSACGVLPVPERRKSRVSQGLDALERAGIVSRFEQWQDGDPLHFPPQPFDEATRCARLIVERWFAS